jgi:hypothetical protein
MNPMRLVRISIGRIGILLLLLALSGCGNKFPDSCPIDGAPAQFTKRLDEKSCEYTHFSAVERRTHNWVADCR